MLRGISSVLIVAAVTVVAGMTLIIESQLSTFTTISDLATHHFSGESFPEAKAGHLPLLDIEHFKAVKRDGDSKIDNAYLNIDSNFVDPESNCEFCTRVEYNAGPQGVAGIAYDSEKLLDLTGAKSVKFWAMGEGDDVQLSFVAAGRPAQNQATQPATDTSFAKERFEVTTAKVILDKDWKKYEIDVSKVNLKDIKTLFGFEVLKGKSADKQVFYLKSVYYDSTPASNPLPTRR